MYRLFSRVLDDVPCSYGFKFKLIVTYHEMFRVSIGTLTEESYLMTNI